MDGNLEECEDKLIWMENLQDVRVKNFIAVENAKTKKFLGEIPRKLEKSIEKYQGLPFLLQAKLTERGYFKLYRTGKEYVIKLDSQILLRSSQLGENVIIRGFWTDIKGDILAYSYSAGTDEGVINIVNLKNGEILDKIWGSIWDLVILDEHRFYYVKFFRKERTPDGIDAPSTRVFLRENGKDKMVFGEGLPASYFIELKTTPDGKYALLTVSYGWSRSSIYFGPLEDPEKWRKVYGGDFMCYPIGYRDVVYILSYEDGGMGKIVTHEGKEIIPPQEMPLENATLLGGRIVGVYLRDASSVLKIYALNGTQLDTMEFDMPGTVEILHTHPRELLLRYSSFTVPYRLYRIRKEMDLIESQEIRQEIGGEYEVGEDWATSRDGTKIHMFIVKKKDARCTKALVFGYGGFRISLTPHFYPHVLPLLEHGGCFVVTNLRGGGEYGEKWHVSGMRENKQNVFDDFVGCLEKLKSQGTKVVAWGRSNGGLLVSTVLTQRPDVVDGALIGYPVIDMLRFHKLYIGAAWIPEYGNPDTEDREFLGKYSPYHNVRMAEYPPVLIYTGLYDDRVHPAHALKFAKKLKDLDAPVYLRVETKSGHIGASQRIRVKELADLMAFVFKIFGL